MQFLTSAPNFSWPPWPFQSPCRGLEGWVGL